MNGKGKEVNTKYVWLHKAHVAAVLFVLVKTAGNLIGTLKIEPTYLLLLIVYLLFSKIIDSILFKKRFYEITLVLAMIVFVSGSPDSPTTKRIFNFLGDYTSLLVFTIALNSILILKKVFKTEKLLS